jgi:hypothetical protein
MVVAMVIPSDFGHPKEVGMNEFCDECGVKLRTLCWFEKRSGRLIVPVLGVFRNNLDANHETISITTSIPIALNWPSKSLQISFHANR